MKGKPHPLRILSHVSFSWHLAEEISEPLLFSIICLERRNNLFQWEKKSTPPNLGIYSVSGHIYPTKCVIYSAIPAMLKSSSHNLCPRLPHCASTLSPRLGKTPKLCFRDLCVLSEALAARLV